MQKGVKVGHLLPALARAKGFNQAQLEELTGIGHSTMSGYWSNRLALGLENGRKIATVLNVSLSDLELPEAEEAVAESNGLRLERIEGELDAIRSLLRQMYDALQALQPAHLEAAEALEAQPRRAQSGRRKR